MIVTVLHTKHGDANTREAGQARRSSGAGVTEEETQREGPPVPSPVSPSARWSPKRGAERGLWNRLPGNVRLCFCSRTTQGRRHGGWTWRTCLVDSEGMLRRRPALISPPCWGPEGDPRKVSPSPTWGGHTRASSSPDPQQPPPRVPKRGQGPSPRVWQERPQEWPPELVAKRSHSRSQDGPQHPKRQQKAESTRDTTELSWPPTPATNASRRPAAGRVPRAPARPAGQPRPVPPTRRRWPQAQGTWGRRHLRSTTRA